MPIDSRHKRQSTTSLLVPAFVPGVVPGAPSAPARLASVWQYSGILAGGEPLPAPQARFVYHLTTMRR